MENSKSNFKSHIVDLSAKNIDITIYKESYDLVFSHMVVEHVKDPQIFHRNCLKIIKTDGIIIHFFATKYSVHTLLNQILPSRLTNWLVFTFQTRKEDLHGKFKAYYRWCYGPTKKNIQRLNKIGYDIKIYNGYLGHNYLNRNRYLHFLEKSWNNLLLRIQSPMMCSNAFFIARKKNL